MKNNHARRKAQRQIFFYRRFAPLRFCAVLFLALAALAQVTPKPRGLAELKKGDYENASKLLTARLASNPNDAVAQRALLRVYIETGRYTEAEAAAKKFLQKTPDSGAVRHELAETLAITGKLHRSHRRI